MASTLTRLGEGGGSAPMRAVGGAQIKTGLYHIAFATYATGGEDISAIWDDFRSVHTITPAQVDATVADRRDFMVDTTNKKLLMFSAFNTENAATDQSAVGRVNLTVVGE